MGHKITHMLQNTANIGDQIELEKARECSGPDVWKSDMEFAGKTRGKGGGGGGGGGFKKCGSQRKAKKEKSAEH